MRKLRKKAEEVRERERSEDVRGAGAPLFQLDAELQVRQPPTEVFFQAVMDWASNRGIAAPQKAEMSKKRTGA